MKQGAEEIFNSTSKFAQACGPTLGKEDLEINVDSPVSKTPSSYQWERVSVKWPLLGRLFEGSIYYCAGHTHFAATP